MIVKRPDQQPRRARAKRRAMTKAEAIPWNSVRDSRLGPKARGQVPVGPSIADFACLASRLVIELDGSPHGRPERQDRHRRRDAWMRQRGWRVLRGPNEIVLGGGEMVLDLVGGAMRKGPSSGLVSRGHLLPLAGEGRSEAAPCP